MSSYIYSKPAKSFTVIKIALFEPEIPPNTGNIMRLCANIGYELHLIEPLGFSLDEKPLRRAGMDYRDLATVNTHKNYSAFCDTIGNARIIALTTKAEKSLYKQYFTADDVLLFGPETRGLPANILDSLDSENKLRIPMQVNSRSLNLSNAVAVVAYEAYRQLEFD